MDKTFIDKLAFIEIQNEQILVSLSKGKAVWYIPGGKRELNETDEQALIREVKEELTVDLIPESIKYYGTYEAQAHGKPEGTIVRMICYTGNFSGELAPSSEIDKIAFFSYEKRHLTTPVDFLIFDDLKKKRLLK